MMQFIVIIEHAASLNVVLYEKYVVKQIPLKRVKRKKITPFLACFPSNKLI